VAAGLGGALAAAGTIYFLVGAPGLEVLASAPSTFMLLLLAMIPAQLVVQYWSASSQPDRQKARYAHSGTCSTPAPSASARRTGIALGLNSLSLI